jgi:hypothetical protein
MFTLPYSLRRSVFLCLQHCAFVESEAEESGSCLSDDDDEENNSDLDNYDSSFVNDSVNQTYTDIQAKFLHSVIWYVRQFLTTLLLFFHLLHIGAM